MFQYGVLTYSVLLEKQLPPELIIEMIIYSVKNEASSEDSRKRISYFLNTSPAYAVLYFKWEELGK